MQLLMYFVSITFQLSGGIILLISNIIMSPKKISEIYCENSIPLGYDEEMGGIKVDATRLESVLKDMYLNRVAFAYLILGYALNVFGAFKNCSVWLAALVIILFSIILSYISYKIVCKMAKKVSENEKYKNSVRNNVPHGTATISYDE